jgi:hypothetical protein
VCSSITLEATGRDLLHSVSSEMFIDSRIISPVARFEGAENCRAGKNPVVPAPSNGAEEDLGPRSIDISPLPG